MKLTPWLLTLATFLMIGAVALTFLYKKIFAAEEIIPQPTTLTVPMALQDLEPGTLVTSAHIGLGPARIADLSADTMRSRESVIGRVVKDPIRAISPLRTSAFYSPGEYPELSVSPGMQAVAISVGSSTGMVDGLLRPGNHVDVHLTLNGVGPDADPRIQNGMTLTLFRGVKILALNRSFVQTTPSRGANTVTVELNPEQARVMLLASQRGELALTFNPDGHGASGMVTSADGDRVTLAEILNLPPIEKPEPPFVTEGYRGGSRSTAHFRDGQRVSGWGGNGGGIGNGRDVMELIPDQLNRNNNNYRGTSNDPPEGGPDNNNRNNTREASTPRGGELGIFGLRATL